MKYLCFGRDNSSGNSAAVYADRAQPPSERLTLSRQGAAATVFVAEQSVGVLQLDFYYPGKISPLCLHASLAACHWYFQQQPQLQQLQLIAALTGVKFRARRQGQQIWLDLQPQQVLANTPEPGWLTQIFGPAGHQLQLVGVYSVGSPKLLIRCQQPTLLAALSPNLVSLRQWSDQHKVSGCYVFCPIAAGLFSGRNFNHLDPALEDQATGVAAGALALALSQSLRLWQGDLQQNPCQLLVEYRNGQLALTGLCQVVG